MEILGLIDREVVEAVGENSYLQYFLGFKNFQPKPPFNTSLMKHFRGLLPQDQVIDFDEASEYMAFNLPECPEEAVLPWILSQMSNAEIPEPEGFRKMLIKNC